MATMVDSLARSLRALSGAQAARNAEAEVYRSRMALAELDRRLAELAPSPAITSRPRSGGSWRTTPAGPGAGRRPSTRAGSVAA